MMRNSGYNNLADRQRVAWGWGMKVRQDKKLTLRQAKFCEEFLTNGCDAIAAARSVGYKDPRMSSRRMLASNPKVKAYISKKVKKMEKEFGVTFDWKVKKLKKIIELTVPDDAENKSEINASAAISAIAETNKMQGHYSAEKIITTNLNADIDVKKVHDLTIELELKYKKDY